VPVLSAGGVPISTRGLLILLATAQGICDIVDVSIPYAFLHVRFSELVKGGK